MTRLNPPLQEMSISAASSKRLPLLTSSTLSRLQSRKGQMLYTSNERGKANCMRSPLLIFLIPDTPFDRMRCLDKPHSSESLCHFLHVASNLRSRSVEGRPERVRRKAKVVRVGYHTVISFSSSCSSAGNRGDRYDSCLSYVHGISQAKPGYRFCHLHVHNIVRCRGL